MNCNFCEFKCDLSQGAGLCKMYAEKNGEIIEQNPMKWARCNATDVERIPFYNYYPGARALQVGGFNCNASCDYCINARIAICPENEIQPFELLPNEIVRRAKNSGIEILHFGVNEVTVNLPSALEVAKYAKENNMKVGCSSNGFMTDEALDMMLEYFDFFNISLKSIKDEFYQNHLGLFSVEPIKRNIEKIAKHAHLEITTPVVRSGNEDEIPEIAEFISSISRDITWHIFRVVPENKMTYDDVPDIGKIVEAITKEKQKLDYIYFGNFIGSNWVDTVCPSCGATVIERLCDCACGARMMDNRLIDGAVCPDCGYKLAIKM